MQRLRAPQTFSKHRTSSDYEACKRVTRQSSSLTRRNVQPLSITDFSRCTNVYRCVSVTADEESHRLSSRGCRIHAKDWQTVQQALRQLTATESKRARCLDIVTLVRSTNTPRRGPLFISLRLRSSGSFCGTRAETRRCSMACAYPFRYR